MDKSTQTKIVDWTSAFSGQTTNRKELEKLNSTNEVGQEKEMSFSDYVSALSKTSDAAEISSILEKFLQSNSRRSPRPSQLDIIRELDNLSALRTKIKIANAKIAKTTREESIRRYREEIELAHKKIMEIETACGNDLKKLKIHGESPERLVQLFIQKEESSITLETEFGLKKSEIKRLLKTTPSTLSQKVREELESIDPECLKILEKRLARGDRRALNVVKRRNLLEALTLERNQKQVGA